GFVRALDATRITTSVDRALDRSRDRLPGFNEKRNQVITGCFPLDERESQACTDLLPRLRFRLDKDEMASGMALVRNNIAQLLAPTTPSRLRELIIDRHEPYFRTSVTKIAGKLIQSCGVNLNDAQK